jgi:hypothetical protein
MKKLLSVIALLTVVSFAVNAQTLKSKKGENYLPEKGDWSIGFNMDGVFSYVGNAFNGTSDNSAPSVDFLHNTTFVGKIYTSDKTATRYTANLGISSDKAGDVSTSSFDITVGYGKEWRKGKTRLQGFYGADALISAASSSSKNGSTTLYKSGMALGVGVNGFLGAEYFIFPKISLGAQYNYGIGFVSQAKGEGTGPTESSSGFALGGVGVNGGSINVNLHF